MENLATIEKIMEHIERVEIPFDELEKSHIENLYVSNMTLQLRLGEQVVNSEQSLYIAYDVMQGVIYTINGEEVCYKISDVSGVEQQADTLIIFLGE
ncbi:MAG: hypothetical protein ATN35_11940 [Epulopiscium sp. Nele67-Bin004]|nr:MAG: hypothetical protein ATN35_11940 [Epulopiscium sp. Nele67-Bin004]